MAGCHAQAELERVLRVRRSTVKGPQTRYIAFGNPYKFGRATRRLAKLLVKIHQRHPLAWEPGVMLFDKPRAFSSLFYANPAEGGLD